MSHRRGRVPLAPGPRLEAHLFDGAQVLPAQLPRPPRATGVRALLARLLADAITEAELGLLGPGKGAVPCSRSPHARWQPAQRDTARRWLRGERR